MSRQQGFLLIVSGASGAGKSTLCQRLMDEFPELRMSVSFTTRAPRGTEREGVHYHFVDRTRFEAMVEANEFAEHALVHGNYYGTARSCVDQALRDGAVLLFDVDYQGAEALRAAYPHVSTGVMVLPPSIEVLLARLQGRGTDSPEVIAARMKKASREIAHYTSFDYLVVNREVEEAYAQLRAILVAETASRGAASLSRDASERHVSVQVMEQGDRDSRGAELPPEVRLLAVEAQAAHAEALLRQACG